jgi:hypothetical protein
MKQLLALLGCLFTLSAGAQYYFNDCVSNRQTHRQYNLLRKWKVRSFTVVALPEQAMGKEEVLVTQEMSTDGKRVVIYANETGGKTNRTVTQYEAGKLVRTTAARRNGEVTTRFFYAPNGLIQRIESTTRDTSLDINQLEVHTYFYKQDTLPDFAYVIRDNSDTVRVEFLTDSLQQVVEEKWWRGTKQLERYYYYYDNSRRLTDIVRFNAKAGKLLPDYIFSYDEEGRTTKMIQVPRFGNNYLTWEYGYDEKGLKMIEKFSSKDRQQAGTLQYRYSY